MAGFAQRQPQNEIVEKQCEQNSVVQANAELRVALGFREGFKCVDSQRNLHRALALHSNQQFDLGTLR